MKFSFTVLFWIAGTLLFSQHSYYNTALLHALENRSLPNDSLNLLVKGKVYDPEFTKRVRVKYLQADMASVQCNKSRLSELFQLGILERAELVAAHNVPLNDTMMYRNRIKAVKLWTAPLPQAYDGKGIIIGIIDTGIDFSHPDFKDSLGKTRIKYIWDQSISNGTYTPQPYNYGREWNAAQIDAGLCTHSDFPHYGHGTGVSGIAAGNAKATGHYEGVASAAQLIVVSLDFNSAGPTIADAVHYIVSKASALGKPFVINASVGDYYGSHDGTDLEAKLIDNLIANIPGRSMIAAAGNAGNIPFHVRTQVVNGDTLFTWFSNSASPLGTSLYSGPNQFQNLKFSIGANRSNYSDLGNIDFKAWNYALNSIKKDTLKHNNHRIGIIETAASVNTNGILELDFQIAADSSNLLWRIESAGQGQHDAWNFDFIDAPLPNPMQYPDIIHYAHPDSLMNMVSSFQCSDEILTVANYVNLKYFVAINNNTVNTGETAGDLALSSSAGPTRDNRQKPDVAATGNNVIAPMCLGWQANWTLFQPQIVAEGSMHVQSGGTSAASPVVAGLAALYLQKNPQATNREILQAVRNCAFKDSYTGNNLPHPRWGYGKLDGKASLLCNEPIVIQVQEHAQEHSSSAYPNPFKNELHLQLRETDLWRLQIFDITGSLLYETDFTGNEITLGDNVKVQNYRGLLMIRASSSSKSYTFKVIKD